MQTRWLVFVLLAAMFSVACDDNRTVLIGGPANARGECASGQKRLGLLFTDGDHAYCFQSIPIGAVVLVDVDADGNILARSLGAH